MRDTPICSNAARSYWACLQIPSDPNWVFWRKREFVWRLGEELAEDKWDIAVHLDILKGCDRLF
jgi:hypothetical protein